MNAFFGFIRKEFLHIIRDRRTMIILFGMPLAQLIIFGYAIRNELNYTGIAILDQSRDEQSRLITDKIMASGYFDVTAWLDHPEQIEEVFRSGTSRLVLVFGNQFERDRLRNGFPEVQIITDASNPNMAQLAQS